MLSSFCHARNHDKLPAKKLKDDKCMLSVDGLTRFVMCGRKAIQTRIQRLLHGVPEKTLL